MNPIDALFPNPANDALVGRNDLNAVYLDVCGATDGSDLAATAGQAGETISRFHQTLGTMRDRFSYLFARDRQRWVEDRFRAYLDDGRGCPEGTPGRESQLPPGEGPLRGFVEQVLMPSHIFRYDRATESFAIDRAILGTPMSDRKALAALFSGINNKAPIVAAGNAITRILWDGWPVQSTLFVEGSYPPVDLEQEELRSYLSLDSVATGDNGYLHFFGGLEVIPGPSVTMPIDAVAFFATRGSETPFDAFFKAQEGAIAAFLSDLKGRPRPTTARPLDLEKVVHAFGYRFSSNTLPKFNGDHFLREGLAGAMAKHHLAVAEAYRMPMRTGGLDRHEAPLLQKVFPEARDNHLLLAAAASIAQGDDGSAIVALQQLAEGNAAAAPVCERLIALIKELAAAHGGNPPASGTRGGDGSAKPKRFGGVVDVAGAPAKEGDAQETAPVAEAPGDATAGVDGAGAAPVAPVAPTTPIR